MKVLVHEDRDIPNVALYLFFKIGSRDERPGVTGISHFFEHMMFNGAKKYGPKQFDIVMEANGGSNNAYTSRDVTVYTDWFPRSALELIMDMESDRMVHLDLDPKMVESERGVVYSERRQRVDNDNFGLLEEQLDAAAFLAHPYGWPVIGWASDIEAWTIDDLRHHYRIGYAPNNCVMVVSGDVSRREVEELAKQYFGGIERQEPPPAVRTVEPEQLGERRVEIRKAAQLPLLMVSYHVPRSADADRTTLEVLTALLTRGRSSRLYRRLVDRDRLALDVSAYAGKSLDPGQLVFYLEVTSGVDPAKAEEALFEEIDAMRKDLADARELEKAKNQLLVQLYRQQKTIAGKANLLGQYEVFHGGYETLAQAGEAIASVSAESVREAARRYLDPKKRTIATLIPEAAAAKESE